MNRYVKWVAFICYYLYFFIFYCISLYLVTSVQLLDFFRENSSNAEEFLFLLRLTVVFSSILSIVVLVLIHLLWIKAKRAFYVVSILSFLLSIAGILEVISWDLGGPVRILESGKAHSADVLIGHYLYLEDSITPLGKGPAVGRFNAY
ncbi:hypothetical protein GCM10023310_23280 [Paenibacillus vulneris]